MGMHSDTRSGQLGDESLERLRAALARVIRPGPIGEWFLRPNPAFDGLKPMEVVERGETDRIWAMIYELESGNAG